MINELTKQVYQDFHPILYSTPMVQAILEERKTMTRRIVKSEHILESLSNGTLPSYFNSYQHGFCHYGKVGDVLWVRETWNELISCYYYRATDSKWCDFWKPSIFMPKAACRIFLEITDIRVERLQDISEEDACYEGIEGDEYDELFRDYSMKDSDPERCKFIEPSRSFETLWQKINGVDSWEVNPFVWVISFLKISKPENFK